jgi:hypothetical protein
MVSGLVEQILAERMLLRLAHSTLKTSYRILIGDPFHMLI